MKRVDLIKAFEIISEKGEQKELFLLNYFEECGLLETLTEGKYLLIEEHPDAEKFKRALLKSKLVKRKVN